MDGTPDYEFGPEIDRPESCALDLKKYFFVIAVVSALVLIGTFWYTVYQSKGTSTAAGQAKKDPAAKLKAAVNWFPRQFGGGKPTAKAPVAGASGTVAPGARGPGARGPAARGPVAVPRPPLNNAQPFGNSVQTPPLNRPQPFGGAQQFGSPMAPALANNLMATVARPNILQTRGGFPDIAFAMRNSVVNITATQIKRNRLLPQKTTKQQTIKKKIADQKNGNGVVFSNPFAGKTYENVGSGVIIRRDGYILTNFHIVRNTNAVSVNVFEGDVTARYPATAIKLDESLDLALLKINAKRPLQAAILGNSDQLRVADNVLAIGSPFGLDQTVSRGIVSAMRKSMVIEGINHSNIIQTDVAINQGNSGGPLISAYGHVVGINTAIYSPTGAFAGISFAIPSNQARQFTGLQLENMAGRRAMQPVAMQNRRRAVGANQVGSGALSFAGPPSGLAMNVAQPLPIDPGPAIRANQRIPRNHNDGRDKMNCMLCHKIKGTAGANQAAFTLPFGTFPTGLAMNVAQPLPIDPGPRIRANQRAPRIHNDGRNKMNCMLCHKIKGAAGANQAAFTLPFGTFPTGLAMNVAQPLPIDPGPPIRANQRIPRNHNDGRDKMNCMLCHQIKGGGNVNQAAFGTQQGMVPGQAMNRAAQLPGVKPGQISIGEVTLGAALLRIDNALADRLNHPRRKGVFVSKVKHHSLAEAAGLKAGDIILKLDGRRMRGPRQLVALLNEKENGVTARLSILRAGRRMRLSMIVAGLGEKRGQPIIARDPNTGVPVAKGQGGRALAAAVAAAAPPRRVPKDFKWKGIEVERFVQLPSRGVRGGKPRIGAKINEVKRGSPAEKAGIKVNDVLLEINGRLAGSPRLMDKAIRKSKGQNNNLLKMMRGPQEFFTLLQ